ncbi:uncharacterized protein AKAME5_000280500 [Lates japonicus]|uniref:EF-hand domain-containing protein n=1 Tax=Lates japonicus TaxID=270547 RepID=A0AAD3QYD6_LATJO|nr:uncharacterized protein AKAME5_000280500 [Lates japonicus]
MPAKTKKKKQRPRKPTKEKQGAKKKNKAVVECDSKVSVDQTCEAFRSNQPEFECFLDEMIQWFSDHQQQVDQYFSLRDADQSGSVHLKDFEFGLMNLGVPCQEFQLHVLTEQLKTNHNTISYQDINRQVQSLRHSSTEVETQGATEPELCCTGSQWKVLGWWKPQSSYKQWLVAAAKACHAADTPSSFPCCSTQTSF